MPLVAATVAVLGVGGVALTVARSGDGTTGSEGTTGSIPPAAHSLSSADGRLTFPAPPDGLELVATGEMDASVPPFLSRVYAFDHAAPDAAAALIIEVLGASPERVVTGNGEAETVQGVPGRLVEQGSTIELDFGLADGRSYRMVGFHLDRETVVRLAETARFDPASGTVAVDESILPAGVTELTVGSYSEGMFREASSFQHPAPRASWSNGRRSLYFASAEQSAAAFAAGRLGFATVDNVTVGGFAGYVATGTVTADRLVVAWFDGRRVYRVVAEGFGDDALLTLLESMRPPNDVEWPTTVSGSPATDASPATEVAAVTTIVVSGAPTVSTLATRRRQQRHRPRRRPLTVRSGRRFSRRVRARCILWSRCQAGGPSAPSHCCRCRRAPAPSRCRVAAASSPALQRLRSAPERPRRCTPPTCSGPERSQQRSPWCSSSAAAQPRTASTPARPRHRRRRRTAPPASPRLTTCSRWSSTTTQG